MEIGVKGAGAIEGKANLPNDDAKGRGLLTLEGDAIHNHAAAAIILGETSNPQQPESPTDSDETTRYHEIEKFWGVCPSEDVWPIFSASGYFDPQTLKRVNGMKRLR